jgi:hypothetical protein
MLSVEYDWLNKNRDECFKYRGEYIAVIGERIVSHSKVLKDVVKETAALYGEHIIPHISKIPPTMQQEHQQNQEVIVDTQPQSFSSLSSNLSS